jgi:hypothetical protein
MNKPEKTESFFNIPKNKDGTPDFLWVAFQSFLSTSPDVWDGETLYKHIEQESFDMECSSQVSIWQPFVGFSKEDFLEAVLVLEDMHINTYLEGCNDTLGNRLDNPSPKSGKGKNKKPKPKK